MPTVTKMMMPEPLLDVIEVQIRTPHTVRVMDRDMTERNAEAYINMAVFRRGVEHSFFTTAPAGTYRDGDEFKQKG